MQWQKIDEIKVSDVGAGHYVVILRAKVPGGWLLLATSPPLKLSRERTDSLTFLPDPAHAWDGT